MKGKAALGALFAALLGAVLGASSCDRLEWKPQNGLDRYSYKLGLIINEDDGTRSSYSCSMQHVGGGIFLTAAHCVGNVNFVIEQGRRTPPMRPLWVERDYDVAMLYSRRHASRPAIDIDCRPLKLGERLELIGYPGGNHMHTFGYVISAQVLPVDTIMATLRWKRLDDGPTLMRDRNTITVREVQQTSILSMGGASGGMVVNNSGKVRAIVSSGAEGYTGVIPASTICKLRDGVPSAPISHPNQEPQANWGKQP